MRNSVADDESGGWRRGSAASAHARPAWVVSRAPSLAPSRTDEWYAREPGKWWVTVAVCAVRGPHSCTSGKPENAMAQFEDLMRRRTAAEGTSTRRPGHSLGPSGRCHLKLTRQRCPMTPLHPTTLVFFVNLPRPHTHTPGSVSDLRGRGVRWPHHIPHTTPPPLALFAFTTRLPWLLPPAPTLDRAATC